MYISLSIRMHVTLNNGWIDFDDILYGNSGFIYQRKIFASQIIPKLTL